MKIVGCFVVIILFRQAIGGIVRNPPAFSKPVYSDSYLPAAMQVIFHAVEQLKLLQSEETIEISTMKSSSTPPIDHTTQKERSTTQEILTTSTSTVMTPQEDIKTDEEELDTDEASKEVENSTKISEVDEESTRGTSVQPFEDPSHQESPEINQETPEINYATPETNYETSEQVHDVQEANQEVLEENHEPTDSSRDEETSMEATTRAASPSDSSLEQESIDEDVDDKKKPTVDSVVQGIYEILKPTTSKFVDEDVEVYGESKSILGFSVDKTEGTEDEDDENRFTRLGEKVTQVPRPSLSSYLRRSNVRPSATLQQLANLYDSLSKDARKQGFGKYTGYSDEVLNTLQTSAEGGIGPQLKKILDKVLERNELTREDARTRTHQAVRDLNNPSSTLNKELRVLLPLRYSR